MANLSARASALLVGILLTFPIAAAPVGANTSSDLDIDYTIETGSNGVEYKLVTGVGGKPLVDQRGTPSPVRVELRGPEPQPPIRGTSCTTAGGSLRPSPVRITYGAWPFVNRTCYEKVGSTRVGVSGVDSLYGGYWTGSVYYETATACVARPFSSRQTLTFENEDLCMLSIEY